MKVRFWHKNTDKILEVNATSVEYKGHLVIIKLNNDAFAIKRKCLISVERVIYISDYIVKIAKLLIALAVGSLISEPFSKLVSRIFLIAAAIVFILSLVTFFVVFVVVSVSDKKQIRLKRENAK